jgi:ribosome-associated translation inhibitor RaiA
MRPDAACPARQTLAMNIEIRFTNVELPAKLVDYVELRVRQVLRSHRDHLDRVLVRLCDSNGPEGGRDVHCNIVARLRGHSIVVHDRGADAYTAATHAIARLRELLTAFDHRSRRARLQLN